MRGAALDAEREVEQGRPCTRPEDGIGISRARHVGPDSGSANDAPSCGTCLSSDNKLSRSQVPLEYLPGPRMHVHRFGRVDLHIASTSSPEARWSWSLEASARKSARWQKTRPKDPRASLTSIYMPVSLSCIRRRHISQRKLLWRLAIRRTLWPRAIKTAICTPGKPTIVTPGIRPTHRRQPTEFKTAPAEGLKSLQCMKSE